MKIRNMIENLEREYDVIVVGVGPAGSSVSKFCAKNGLKVLAVEKRQEIGSPKRCGEGLSKSSMERMGIEGGDSWKVNTINGAVVYSPSGKWVKADFGGPEGWVIERKIFDKYLANLAVKAGTKIVTKTDVFDVRKEKDGIVVMMRHNGETFQSKAKILVACDGVESRIARMMGINTTIALNDICSCVQYEMTGIKTNSHMLELFFGNNIAPGGYVWIFPKGDDTANVGIGVRKPFSKKSALEYLEDFINSREDLRKGSVIEVNSGGVPVGGFLRRMVSDNFMVVGDAAHQINPIHGGGISEAYVAGRIAAGIIAKAFEKKDFSAKTLSEYESKWENERGKSLKKVLKLRQVVENLSDEELDWLAGYLKGEELVDMSKASGFKRLAFVLMKKPRLIGLAKKLV